MMATNGDYPMVLFHNHLNTFPYLGHHPMVSLANSASVMRFGAIALSIPFPKPSRSQNPLTTIFKKLSAFPVIHLQPFPHFPRSVFRTSSAILKSELLTMSTPAFLDANRRNEILNAGTRSDAAFPSTTPVLAFEDKVAYQTLVETLTSEFNPQCEHESFLVQQMVDARWRLTRIRRIETAAFNLLLGEADDNPYARLAEALRQMGGDLMSKLERFAAASERSYLRAHKELQASMKPRKQQQAAAGSRRDDALLQLVLGPPVCKTKPIPKPVEMEEEELELLTRPVSAASPKPSDRAAYRGGLGIAVLPPMSA